MAKKRTAVLVLAAVCFLSYGTHETVAYLTDRGQIENHMEFTGEDGLKAVLTEPSWNPEKGLLTVPGVTIPKDPVVTNTSELNMDELIAVKCEFVYTQNCPNKELAGQTLSEKDMKWVAFIYQIDYNSDDAKKADWIRFEGQDKTSPIQCFYYKDILKRNFPEKGDVTKPLFTCLKIDQAVNHEQFSHIQDIGGFDIKLSGHAIQQMTDEKEFGLHSAQNAYAAKLFTFDFEN